MNLAIFQDVVASSATHPQNLEPLTDELAEAYEKLAYDACGCISITSNSDLGDRIKTSVGHLGKELFIESMGMPQTIF